MNESRTDIPVRHPSIDATDADTSDNNLQPTQETASELLLRIRTNATGTPALKLNATTQRRLVLNEDTIKHLEEIIEPESKYWVEVNDVLIQWSNSLGYLGAAALIRVTKFDFVFDTEITWTLKAKIQKPTVTIQ